jgi:hypothetical protein
MKQITITILVALKLTALSAFSAERPEDCLTTKTTRYGKNPEIVIAVRQDPENWIEIVVDDRINARPKTFDVPIGKGIFKVNVRVKKGWSVTINKDGVPIDRETAMKKTGIGRIPNF